MATANFSSPPSAMAEPQSVVIERLGHLGDGIATGPDGPLHIPLAAPGDVFAPDPGDPSGWRLAKAGPSRADPPCPHYGACGGCNLQHVSAHSYAQAKREWVIAALARQGIKTEVDPLVPVAPGRRRRATFAAMRRGSGVLIGFHRARSHEIVEVPRCLVVRPRLIKALAAIKDILVPRLGHGGAARITITEADNGLGVAINSKPVKFEPLGAPELEGGCIAGIVRASWNGELLYATDTVRLTMSGVRIELPSGAFIQAARECEEALAARVGEALQNARKVADLYCGVGTFTFALARSAAIDAFDADAPSISALVTAARRAEKLKPVAAAVRDLARRPLMANELTPYDGVVLDPPRAGAEAQARQLARSSVPRIAYVSCSPASFAHDARLLVEGGYLLQRVTPVDQFLWSHHVELVGVFQR